MSADSDSTFLRNFALVIGLLVGVTILLLIVVNTFSGGGDAERQALAQERAERNLAPDYAVRLSGEPAPAVASGEAEAEAEGGVTEVRSGEQVTQAVCIACHQGNFQNAPGIGDQDGWGERIGKGWETLTTHVSEGYGNMPAQGGAASEEEIRAAIEYMIEDETGLEIPES